VCAALPSVSSHLKSVFKYHPEHLTPEQCNQFFLNNCNKFLSSVGIAIDKNKRLDSKVTKNYQKLFDKFLSYRFLNDCELILDSAGYQFQQGEIDKRDTEKWIRMYHDFLIKNKNNFAYAFLFDPVPGATDTVLESYEEMEKLNALSYSKASDLPSEIRNKMLYIHHFRTPKIRRLYAKLMDDYGFANNFRNFSTGGLVSFNVNIFPVVMYSIPLIDIISHAKKRRLKEFRFHVLGATDFKDIIFHKFIEYHVKKIHNINIEITYDSSTVFQTLMMGRYLYIPDKHRNICKMSLRSELLDQKWMNSGLTNEEMFFRQVDEIISEYNFPKLDSVSAPIYPTNIIHRTHYVYGMFLMLKFFNDAVKWAEELIEKIYPIYEAGDNLKFNSEMEKIMIRFNGGKPTKKVEGRTIAIFNSLKIIESLDKEYCDYLVDTYFSRDECPKLAGKETCLFG